MGPWIGISWMRGVDQQDVRQGRYVVMSIEGKKASSFPLGGDCQFGRVISIGAGTMGLVGGMSLRAGRSGLWRCGRQSCVVKGQGNSSSVV